MPLILFIKHYISDNNTAEDEDEDEAVKFGEPDVVALFGCLSKSTQKINTQSALLPQ